MQDVVDEQLEEAADAHLVDSHMLEEEETLRKEREEKEREVSPRSASYPTRILCLSVLIPLACNRRSASKRLLPQRGTVP